MRHIATITSDPIPSSFVKRPLKFASETGNGEAKLYLRKEAHLSQEVYSNFFYDFNNTNVYRFSKDNLLCYLETPSIHLEYNNNFEIYNGISPRYYYSIIQEVRLLPEYIEFNLEAYGPDEQNRYYIRSMDNIFKNIFRGLVIPKKTTLEISKYLNSSNKYIFEFKLIPISY